MTEPVLDVTDTPDADDLAGLGDALSAFNAALVGPAGRRALAVFLRDGMPGVQGGIWGYTAWGWLYVQWLWLAEDWRGRGWAGRMLDAAEAEARARGCHGAWIDTFNPAALSVYRRQGYTPFGQLEGFPAGHVRVFLKKSLQP